MSRCVMSKKLNCRYCNKVFFNYPKLKNHVKKYHFSKFKEVDNYAFSEKARYLMDVKNGKFE